MENWRSQQSDYPGKPMKQSSFKVKKPAEDLT